MKDYGTVVSLLGQHLRTYASKVIDADISASDLDRLTAVAVRFLNDEGFLRLERVKIVPYIRGTHRYHFRSGEWAKVTGVELISGKYWLGLRPCYMVEFPDGKTDSWPVGDTDAGYEFQNMTVIPS